MAQRHSFRSNRPKAVEDFLLTRAAMRLGLLALNLRVNQIITKDATMTYKKSGIKVLAACVGLTALLNWSGSAQTYIYNNSVNDLKFRFNPGALQVGDEIIVAGGPGQFLTRFTFEFYGTNNVALGGAFTGPVQAQVRFYQNNGPLFNGYPTPGTMFYNSGLFAVPTTDAFGRATFDFQAGTDFPNGGLFLPDADFTWSVQFSGMLLTDEVGVDIYDPVVVGANYPDYWENSGGSWSLKTNIVNMN